MFDFLFGWRKASKCKRLLRHVQCRLVLLKNKRCSIVRQLRQDVAELLKLGHSQIAFTRAEQIYKDERIIEVYDLLDHFCEFIVINIRYIRSHKDCPNDISEAISSLIFASARCGDIPELRKVRKLFAERYGQRFVMSALELLPGNLVNCQIRNNLSIRTVVEDVKLKVVNEIFRDCNFLGGGSETLEEHNSEWHRDRQQTKGFNVDETSRLKDDEVLCITLPGCNSVDQHSSPSKALVPVTQGCEELINIPDESKTLVPVTQCFDENVFDLDDIQEFQSSTKDVINLQDQRVFLFKSLVLGNKQKFMDDDIHVIESFRRTGKKCNRRSRKRSLSKEYWSFKDLSYESYYCNNQRKQWKNNTEFTCGEVCKCRCHSIGTDMTRLKKASHCGSESSNATEEGSETEFYSCNDFSSGRSISMTKELVDDMERQRYFEGHTSLPLRQLEHGNHIHPKLPDYKELETTFLALKHIYLQNSSS